MNFSQIAKMQELKNHLTRFQANHPKFPMFLKAVSKDALMEDSIIEINVTTPDGRKYETNLKVKPNDLAFIQALQNLNK